MFAASLAASAARLRPRACIGNSLRFASRFRGVHLSSRPCAQWRSLAVRQLAACAPFETRQFRAQAAALGFRLPRVIGHRGAAALAPENTLAGIRRAAALGCGMVEFDVKLTRDGEVVLFHDHVLDRTTDGRGDTRELTLAEIRALDAGSHFGGDFEGERVPTLEEALEEMVRLGLHANVELKPCPGTDEALAEATLARLARRWPASRPPLLLSSFNPASLAAARRLSPATPRGLLLEEPAADWAELAAALECASLHVDRLHASDELLAAARGRAMPVLCYTVNDAAEAAGLFARGVAAVFSDYPDLERRAAPASTPLQDGMPAPPLIA